MLLGERSYLRNPKLDEAAAVDGNICTEDALRCFNHASSCLDSLVLVARSAYCRKHEALILRQFAPQLQYVSTSCQQVCHHHSAQWHLSYLNLTIHA
jgi:hypothetical protein